jgi:hypothetical protein
MGALLAILASIPAVIIGIAIVRALFLDLRKAGRGMLASVLLTIVTSFGLVTVVLFLFSFGTTLLRY